MSAVRPRRIRIPRAVLAVAAAGALTVGLGGCGAIDTVGRELVKHYTGLGDDPGSFPMGAPGDTDIGDLATGDCFDDPEDDSLTVDSVDCDEEHANETTAVVTLPEGPYPGDIGIDKQTRAICETALEDYVVVDFTESTLDYGYWTPDEGGWRQGDRDVICYAYDWNYDALTSSVKNSGR